MKPRLEHPSRGSGLGRNDLGSNASLSFSIVIGLKSWPDFNVFDVKISAVFDVEILAVAFLELCLQWFSARDRFRYSRFGVHFFILGGVLGVTFCALFVLNLSGFGVLH